MSDRAVPKRVLHIVSTMDRGGAETLLMNVYRNIDRSNLQFDFVSHSQSKCDYEDEVKNLGGHIYKIPSLGQLGAIGYIKRLLKIMASEKYVAIHSHTDFQSGLPALAARLSGIKNRICHSHSTSWHKGNQLKDKVMFRILQKIIQFAATSYCACSREAAAYLFGMKAVDKGHVHILNNGIDVRNYLDVSVKSTSEVRREVEIPSDAIIIGHVGRFSESKNQQFILKLLKRLIDEGNNYVAILVGNGPLLEQAKAKAIELGISNNVRFLGVRSDIARLMKAFDVFVFPSLFEGFGMVALEAQCAGTPCVVSDTVPKTTDMGLNLITYVSLEKDISYWTSEINKSLSLRKPNEKVIEEMVTNKGFNIKSNTYSWLSLYGLS